MYYCSIFSGISHRVCSVVGSVFCPYWEGCWPELGWVYAWSVDAAIESEWRPFLNSVELRDLAGSIPGDLDVVAELASSVADLIVGTVVEVTECWADSTAMYYFPRSLGAMLSCGVKGCPV